MRIAIVDDDAGIRTNLARAVDRFGDCSCVGKFESGEAALTGLSACQPDVVLMDINMPGMDGIECVRQLKHSNHHMEFIMLTVYEDTDSIFNALAAGASGYLLKRAERKELLTLPVLKSRPLRAYLLHDPEKKPFKIVSRDSAWSVLPTGTKPECSGRAN